MRSLLLVETIQKSAKASPVEKAGGYLIMIGKDSNDKCFVASM
jgi:hypothetical protein